MTEEVKQDEMNREELNEEKGKACEPAAEKTAETKSAKDEKDKKKKEHEKLKKEIDDLKDEAAGLKDRLLRSAAEFDNYRKRTEKEKQGSIAFGTNSAVEKILPVLDSLEMAANAECKDEEYKKGVLLTVNLFQNALKNMGVEEIEALDKPFDPLFHNAVAREQSEEKESGTVLRVLQKGYRAGDKVIRHAMVSVAE